MGKLQIKLASIDWGKWLVRSAIGVFAIAFFAQVVGGYVLNRIEENRRRNQTQDIAAK